MTTFWSLLFTFLSSTASRYLFIFILILSVAGGFYLAHLKRVELEKEKALIEYNTNQLLQNIKDKEKLINDLNQINKNKDQAVVLLQQKLNDINDKLKSIESEVDVSIGKGEDRPASNILKNVFKRLGNQE
jgi:hypothetical protein